MGRIIAPVRIENPAQPSFSIKCDALVDTGASFMVLPMAWRDRLGDLETMTEVEMETATQETLKGIVCGPVRIQIEGFRPIHHEVAFVEMAPQDGEYEPLIGYLVLEHSQADVDVLAHRLVKIKHMDLKWALTDVLLQQSTGNVKGLHPNSNHIVASGGKVIAAE